jgi:hypothetical protein
MAPDKPAARYARGVAAYTGLNRTDAEAVWSFQGWAFVGWSTAQQVPRALHASAYP